MENFKENHSKLLYQQRELLYFVKNLKEKLKISESRLSTLMNENQSLKVRAAVAWEEFTPRADFKNTFQVLNLDEK